MDVDRTSILGASEDWNDISNSTINDAVQRFFKNELENMFCLACGKYVRVKTPDRIVAHQKSRDVRFLFSFCMTASIHDVILIYLYLSPGFLCT